jgi:hypothetical protein
MAMPSAREQVDGAGEPLGCPDAQLVYDGPAGKCSEMVSQIRGGSLVGCLLLCAGLLAGCWRVVLVA